MNALVVISLITAGIFFINYIIDDIKKARKGIDDRTPEQKLMDTTINDRVTRFGSAVEAMNAYARGEKPKTRF